MLQAPIPLFGPRKSRAWHLRGQGAAYSRRGLARRTHHHRHRHSSACWCKKLRFPREHRPRARARCRHRVHASKPLSPLLAMAWLVKCMLHGYTSCWQNVCQGLPVVKHVHADYSKSGATPFLPPRRRDVGPPFIHLPLWLGSFQLELQLLDLQLMDMFLGLPSQVEYNLQSGAVCAHVHEACPPCEGTPEESPMSCPDFLKGGGPPTDGAKQEGPTSSDPWYDTPNGYANVAPEGSANAHAQLEFWQSHLTALEARNKDRVSRDACQRI